MQMNVTVMFVPLSAQGCATHRCPLLRIFICPCFPPHACVNGCSQILRLSTRDQQLGSRGKPKFHLGYSLRLLIEIMASETVSIAAASQLLNNRRNDGKRSDGSSLTPRGTEDVSFGIPLAPSHVLEITSFQQSMNNDSLLLSANDI
jgi:hypothetical protein